ncbi:MAG: HIRAN domain-containing protein [Planctomycetota bacterium]
MRVYLTTRELELTEGRQLLAVCQSITEDGRLDLDEIKLLWRWLRKNSTAEVAAVPYLLEILDRITTDRIIDSDELHELHLAVERVIPKTHRQPAIDARTRREFAKKEKNKELKRREKAIATERKQLERQYVNRIKHSFAKVAGVSFPKDDGSDRQRIIKRCRAGERLVLGRERDNPYSEYAVKIVRENGQQIGYAPDYLAERICASDHAFIKAVAYVSSVTGGTWSKPTRGINILVLFPAADVQRSELEQKAHQLLSNDQPA